MTTQLSLFDNDFDNDQTQPETQQPEPTREELLAALERLFQATEAQCDLLEIISDVHMGVRLQRSRAERLCPGYENRITANEHDLTTMIYRLYIVVLTSSPEVFRMRAYPDRILVRECVDIAAAWLRCHPQPESEARNV